MLQHALDDAIGAPSVFGDLFQIAGQHPDRLVDFGALVLVEYFPLFPPLKKGGLDLVEVYGRLGDRVSGQASERLSEASTGSRPTWPAAAAGPVRRTLSRVGLGSIIRVIGAKAGWPESGYLPRFLGVF